MQWGLWDGTKARTEPLATVEAETHEEAKRRLLARAGRHVAEPIIEPAPVEGRCHVGWYFSGPGSGPVSGRDL